MLITTICLFSFTDYNKASIKSKNKFFTCSPAYNFTKTRSGGYVTISWQGPANAYYTYVAYSTLTGGSVSGTTYSTSVQFQDRNEGGTITTTAHCTDNTTSSQTHYSWSPN